MCAASDRLVATIGLKDLVIVDTPDVLLICPASRAEEVKDVGESAGRRRDKTEYL